MTTVRIIAGKAVTITGNVIYKHEALYEEILCIFCAEPKWVSTYRLPKGDGLAHRSCRRLNNNKVSAEERAVRILFVAYNSPYDARKQKIGYPIWQTKRRKLHLSFAQFKKIVLSPCYYCGGFSEVFSQRDNKQVIQINGIDRINNEKEYTIDNCTSCCITCNRAKFIMSYNEFMAWIARLCAYNYNNIDMLKIA